MLYDDVDKNIDLMLQETPFSLAEKSKRIPEGDMDVVFLLAYLGLGLLKKAEATGNLGMAIDLFKKVKASSLN